MARIDCCFPLLRVAEILETRGLFTVYLEFIVWDTRFMSLLLSMFGRILTAASRALWIADNPVCV